MLSKLDILKIFSKSCLPGVRNQEFTSDRVYNDFNYWNYGHLCDLCHGTASHYCDRYSITPGDREACRVVSKIGCWQLSLKEEGLWVIKREGD